MIAFNAASQLFALGAVLVIQLVYMILVARTLGPQDFGIFSFAWSLVQIFLMAGDLGLHNAVIRQISRERQKATEIAGRFFHLKVLLTALLLGLIWFLCLTVPLTTQGKFVLAVFGGGMFFHSLSLGISALFQAHGKLYWSSLNIVLIFGSQFLLGTLLIYSGGRLRAVAAAYLMAALLGLVLNALIFSYKVHRLRRVKESAWSSFMREIPAVGLGNLFSTTSSRAGITLLTLLLGPFQAGIYSAAGRLVLASSNIPLAVVNAVLPVMASHQQDRQAVLRLFYRSSLILGVVSVPMALGLFLLAPDLIRIIYGSEYLQSVTTLRILAWTLVPLFWGMACSQIVLSQDRLIHRFPWVAGSALLVNLSVNLLLIPSMGSQGAAVALLLSETTLAVGYLVSIRRFVFSY